MNARRILFGGAFLLAIVASFAFKNRKKTTKIQATYYYIYDCAWADTDQDGCAPGIAGSQCTVTFADVPYQAFVYAAYGSPYACTIPLYFTPALNNASRAH